MRKVLELYRRFERWAGSLSRGAYAAVVALATGVAVAGIGSLVSMADPLFRAVTMAATMFVVYYAMDPRRES